MNTTYSEGVQQRGEDYRLIQEATTHLEEILGESAGHADVQWDLQPDDRGPVYRVTLKDFTGEVSRELAPDELHSPHLLRFGLYRLWGDLLHEGNRSRIASLIGQANRGDGNDAE